MGPLPVLYATLSYGRRSPGEGSGVGNVDVADGPHPPKNPLHPGWSRIGSIVRRALLVPNPHATSSRSEVGGTGEGGDRVRIGQIEPSLFRRSVGPWERKEGRGQE